SSPIQLGGAPAIGTAAAPVLPGMLEALSTPAALPLPTAQLYQQQSKAGKLLPIAGCQIDASGCCPIHAAGKRE
ncbi:MAG: hypothetical protein RR377_25150, partial [Pseudomonas sp.]